MHRIIIVILMCLLAGTYMSAQQHTQIRFMPHWLHQAQFAGYYMALEKGFYESHGLDVEILDGGPAFPAGKVFENNLADIGTMFLSGAIELSDAGMPLVNIGQLSKKSALIFVTRKSDSINSTEDFNGKRIGVWRSDFQELPLAFIKKYGIEAEIVPVTSTINLFLSGGVDIMCVMWYNEYNQIYLAGIDYEDMNAYFFFDYGLNFPEDGIYCLASFYKDNREACRNFVKATLEGWQYAFANKDEALDKVLEWMKKRNIPANAAQQRWMLNIMEKVYTEKDGTLNARLNRQSFIQTGEVLLESGSIQRMPDFEKFNKTE